MAKCNCNHNNTATVDAVTTNILQGACVDGLLINKPACCFKKTCTYVPPCPPYPCMPFCQPFTNADGIG